MSEVKLVPDKFSLSLQDKLLALMLGLVSALPLLFLLTVTGVWLQYAGISLVQITYLSWMGISYSLKFIWAPALDRRFKIFSSIDFRKAWVLVSLVSTGILVASLGSVDPAESNLELYSFFAIVALATLSSALLDTSIDGYRNSTFHSNDVVGVSALFVAGYRLGLIASGSLTLIFISIYSADTMSGFYNPYPWQLCCYAVGGFLIFSAFGVGELMNSALTSVRTTRTTFHYWGFLTDFKNRFSIKILMLLLMFLTSFRMMDMLQGGVTHLFLLELDYSLFTVSVVNQLFGLVAALGGALFGGYLLSKYSLFQICMASVVLCSLTNLGYLTLTGSGQNVLLLAIVVGLENLFSGVASTVFLVFLSNITNQKYSSAQFAFYTSIMALLPRLLGGFAGWIIESFSFSAFFLFTTTLGSIALLPLLWLKNSNEIAWNSN